MNILAKNLSISSTINGATLGLGAATVRFIDWLTTLGHSLNAEVSQSVIVSGGAIEDKLTISDSDTNNNFKSFYRGFSGQQTNCSNMSIADMRIANVIELYGKTIDNRNTFSRQFHSTYKRTKIS